MLQTIDVPVESHNVDTAKLLGEHDRRRGNSGAAAPRDSEELGEARDVGGALDCLRLLDELDVGVVQVTSRLDLVVADLAHRCPGICEAPLFHVPTRRLGTHVDEDGEGDRGDEGGAELETPGDSARVL